MESRASSREIALVWWEMVVEGGWWMVVGHGGWWLVVVGGLEVEGKSDGGEGEMISR